MKSKKLPFIPLAIVALSFSCEGNPSKAENLPKADSSLYLNEKIQMGDTVLNLVKKGLAVPEIDYEDFYLLTDNTFAGIAFKCQALIRHKDGRVNSLSYISDPYANKDAFQSDVTKFFKYMSARQYKMTVGSPEEDDQKLFKSKSQEYTWESPTKTVSLTITKSEAAPGWGNDTYSMRVFVALQDSIVEKYHLKNLFYNQ